MRKLALHLGALLLLAGCDHPGDPVTATRGFFEAIAAGKTVEAYQETSFTFRATQTEQNFSAAALQLNLVNGKVQVVQQLDAGDREAHVRAIVATPAGVEREFQVLLQPEAGKWRVADITSDQKADAKLASHLPAQGRMLTFNDASSPPMPSDADVRRLVSGALSDFANALAKQSFDEFYSHIAQRWRSQVTQRQLERAFQQFINIHVDLTGAVNREPVFDTPPVISAEGLLLASGHFPSKPYEVVFAFKFIYEEPEWKLFGMDVNLRPAAGVAAPAAATPTKP